MNATDYGGGTPVVDIWRRDIGIAVGHIETKPLLVSLPVSMPSETEAELAIAWNEQEMIIKSGESMTTYTTFVAVHRGDFFDSLTTYRTLMERQGLVLPDYPETAYEPIWCAWGYERDFKVEEVLETLPKVKELGYKWAVLDDGWQTAEGDWYLNPDKFSNGDADMKALVDTIH